jgi:hypothetical protein
LRSGHAFKYARPQRHEIRNFVGVCINLLLTFALNFEFWHQFSYVALMSYSLSVSSDVILSTLVVRHHYQILELRSFEVGFILIEGYPA